MQSNIEIRSNWLLDNSVNINKFIIDERDYIRNNIRIISRNKILHILEGIFLVFYYRRYIEFIDNNETFILAKELFQSIRELWNDLLIVSKIDNFYQNILNNTVDDLPLILEELDINFSNFKHLSNGYFVESIDENIRTIVNTYINRDFGDNWNTPNIEFKKPIGIIQNPFYNVNGRDNNIVEENRINENIANEEGNNNGIIRRLVFEENVNNNQNNNQNNNLPRPNIQVRPNLIVRNFMMDSNAINYTQNYTINANSVYSYNLTINVGNRITNIVIPVPLRNYGPYPANNRLQKSQQFYINNFASRDLEKRIDSAMSVKRKIEHCNQNYSSGECMICLENTDSRLSCGHGCHQECLIPTMEMKCPMCKKEVELEDDVAKEIFKKRILSGKSVPVVLNLCEEPGVTNIINWI